MVIQWVPMGDHAKVKQPIVDVVSDRKGDTYVADYLQRLHDLKELSLTERASIEGSTRPREARPYSVTRHLTISGELVLDVGHNPALQARKVKNLVVSVDDDTDFETVTYEPYCQSG